MAKRRGTKKERAAYISRRAYELATSGKYEDYRQIELALCAEGYDEARQELDSPFLRKELNELCRQARTHS